MKKLITFIVLISVMFSGVSVASAAWLGTLSTWSADTTHTDRIYRWGPGTLPTIWSKMEDDSISVSDFGSYVSHARDQWKSAGINTAGVNEKSQARITIQGGTYNTLREIQSTLLSNDAGLTSFTTATLYKEGAWKVGGTSKDGYRLSGGQVRVFIVKKTFNFDDSYKKTTTHELGHALGWIGHSSNSNDIMYSASSSVTTLTSRDKNHLNQVYK